MRELKDNGIACVKRFRKDSKCKKESLKSHSENRCAPPWTAVENCDNYGLSASLGVSKMGDGKQSDRILL